MRLSSENNIKFSVFIIGFTTMITQIILLRLFLSIFNGNELIIGIVLSNWMILTALGAYLGRRTKNIENKPLFVFIAHLLMGILPLLTVFFVFYLRYALFPTGVIFNLGQILFGTLLLMLPFCLLSGILFTYFSTQISVLGYTNQINNIYSFEAIGSITGGIIFNFLLIFLFNSIFSLKLLMIINFGTALYLSYKIQGNSTTRIVGIATILLAGAVMMIDINSITLNLIYNNQKIIDQKDSAYGEIVVTEIAGQYSFFENGTLLYSNDNTVEFEEDIHFAMLQHPNPENILLISGGIEGTSREILKYNIKSLDYFEINTTLFSLTSKYGSSQNLDNKKIQIIKQDPRRFLNDYNKVYDVVIINLPDPINTNINRYYTLEFFEELKHKLSPSGIVSLSLSSSAGLLSDEGKQLHNTLYSTLNLIFDNVIIIPGMRNHFLASDGLVSAEIGGLSRMKGVINKYINPNYLDDNFINEKRLQIEETITDDITINYDFMPVSFILHKNEWFNKSRFNTILVALILLVIIILIIPRLHIVNLGLFTTGFTATSLELILLIAFQVIYGYIYFVIGILITVFMIGLAIGSLYLHKKFNDNLRTYSLLQYAIGIFAILMPLVLTTIKVSHPGNLITQSVFVIFILLTGMLTGTQFAIGTKLRIETISNTASSAYSSDLLGSALGALIAAVILVPIFGIIKVCLILGSINFLTGLWILIKSSRLSVD